MAKPTLQFTVKPHNRNRQIRVLASELDKRTAAIIEWFPYLVAEQALADIVRMAPGDIPGYPGMLALRRVTVKGVDQTIGILAPGYKFSTKLRQEDAETTLLFIKANKKMDLASGEPRFVSEAACVLSKHSPWTVGTLPYEPDRRAASIRAIRVTPAEVKKIEAMRQKELPAIQQRLQKAGVKQMRSAGERIERRVTKDLGFEVLRREFGIQAKPSAHWRPAIRAARTEYVDAALKKLVRWLTVPSEKRWQKSLVIQQEQGSVISRVKRFQQAVSG